MVFWVNLTLYPICPYLLAFFGFRFACFLDSWHSQPAADPLVQPEQKAHAFNVRGAGLFTTTGQVGRIYGSIYFLVRLEQDRVHAQRAVKAGQRQAGKLGACVAHA